MCILLKDGETEIVEKTIKKKSGLLPFRLSLSLELAFEKQKISQSRKK